MSNTIRIRVYDLALFLKENFEEIITYDQTTLSGLALEWNRIVKRISTYGYFFDGESEEDGYYDRYWTPPTSIAIKSVRLLFGLNKSDNIITVLRDFLGSYIDEFNDQYNLINSYSKKRRWRTIGKAKASLYPRYL